MWLARDFYLNTKDRSRNLFCWEVLQKEAAEGASHGTLRLPDFLQETTGWWNLFSIASTAAAIVSYQGLFTLGKTETILRYCGYLQCQLQVNPVF